MDFALLLSELPQFYYSCFADFRGRLYSDGDYINYQGGKIGLSLLKFKVGAPIGNAGINRLSLYGASIYGKRLSNADSLNWIAENKDNIMTMFMPFILKAKNIPSFVAFCMEYRDCMSSADPVSFVSNLPIQIDCTCSGLQHMAGLLADFKIAFQTNLTESSDRQDVYTNVAKNLEHSIINMFGRAIPLTRNMIKKIVMTVPYNAKVTTATEYFFTNFHPVPSSTPGRYEFQALENPEIRLSHDELTKLAVLIYKSFYNMYDSIDALVKYFNGFAKLMSDLGINIRWVTPKGLIIVQRYVKFEKVKLEMGFGKRNIWGLKPTSTINNVKQKSALMPNVIHSLDADHLTGVVSSPSFLSVPLFTIHDCFATIPSNVDLLELEVKKEFVQIYASRDFLDRFHNNQLGSISDYDSSVYILSADKRTVKVVSTGVTHNIPTIPVLGDFDINNVLDSKYMVS